MASSSVTQDGRVVIALSQFTESDPAIAAAALLAKVNQAELIGLFIQDDTLVNLAKLPFTQAIKYGDATPRRLKADAVTTAIARAEAACRQELSTQADKAKLRWSFVTERGELSSMLAGLVAVGDTLVISGQAQGFGAGQLIREIRTSPMQLSGVLVSALQGGSAREGPVIAIDDGDEKGEQTIRLASQIARFTGNDLVLFVVADSDATASLIIARAHKISNPDQSISCHRFPPGFPQSISAATGEFSASFIVADLQGEPFLDDKDALALFRAAKAPVLLLR